MAAAKLLADVILYNAKIAVLDMADKFLEAIAIKDGLVLATGTTAQIVSMHKGANTQMVCRLSPVSCRSTVRCRSSDVVASIDLAD